MEAIIEKLRQAAGRASMQVVRQSEGVVLSVGDGIATISGLYGASLYELLEFPGGVKGIAFDLDPAIIRVVLLEGEESISTGDPVRLTGRTLSVPVGEGFIGRVISPIGRPLDGFAPPAVSSYYPLERVAPGVVKRDYVSQPVYTGIRAIDSMIPIGRGQRELIVGDSATGKTSIAIDTIINQKGKDILCVYVAVGQKVSTTLRVVEQLKRHDAMGHTLVVCAGRGHPAWASVHRALRGLRHSRVFFRQGHRYACRIRRPDKARRGVPLAFAPASDGLPAERRFRAIFFSCTPGCWSAPPSSPAVTAARP